MNKVSFMASRVLMGATEQNDIYMTVVMRMFSTAPNRNGFAVSEAFIDNIVANADKYTCLP